MKTYSASSGYTYQYFYEGQRRTGQRGGAGTEFVFRVSSDRANWRSIGVNALDNAIAEWQAARDRELSSSERYAVAKLTLFHLFDECPVPEAIPDETRISREAIDAIAETLGW